MMPGEQDNLLFAAVKQRRHIVRDHRRHRFAHQPAHHRDMPEDFRVSALKVLGIDV